MQVPPQKMSVKGLLDPSNVFVQHNIGSKFILLNRPEALNAINIQMIRDLHAAYKEIEDNESIGLVLLYGAGEKSFCAGGETCILAAAD